MELLDGKLASDFVDKGALTLPSTWGIARHAILSSAAPRNAARSSSK